MQEIAVALIIAMLLEQRIALARIGRKVRRHGERLDALDGGDKRKEDSGGHSITAALCLAVVGLGLLTLGGCSLASRESKQLETGAVRGAFNGNPVDVQWQRDTDGVMRLDLNVPGMVAGGVAAAVDATPWGGILGATAAAAMAAWGEAQRRRANYHQRDADEGWQLYRQTVEKRET